MQHPCVWQLARPAARVTAALAVLALVSCGGGGFPRTYPVKGKILVNGQPANECQIYLTRTATDSTPVPVRPQAVTNNNGEFQLTTFNTGDGAPEGEYVVTIEWRTRTGMMKQDFEGPDQLAGAYAKAEKTRTLKGFVIQVGKDALELPPFQLRQTEEAKQMAEEARRQRSFGGPLQ